MTDYRPFLRKVLDCMQETQGVIEFALIDDEPWHIVIYPVLSRIDGEEYVEGLVIRYDALADIFEECAEGSMIVDPEGLDIVGKYETHEVCLHIYFDPLADTKPFARKTGKGPIELVDQKAESQALN
jgi:hypothetical protein